MTKTHLNLARALRPKNFGSVFGQDIPIRMLCNGLALGKLFPTYIFSGQRGCGKTTTARIFAGALNCQNLEQALKSKLLEIPCNSCDSCQMMLAGNHPDFVEIDAASHTGVDNVRQILEAATYLPVVGQRKIYLIDEAHMLSKSAFNAFLKMLEEPPASAIFLLATTEIAKIPDTVCSRAFQAIFNPVSEDQMVPFLKKICTDEKINLSDQVLKIVAKQSEGSLRDALNISEQIHWACDGKSEDEQLEITSKMFGLVTSDEVIQIGELVVVGKPKELIERFSSKFFLNKKPELVWRGFGEFLSSLLRVKLGADPLFGGNASTKDKFDLLAKDLSLEKIKSLGLFFWNNEELFLRTIHKQLFLEHIFIQMASGLDAADNFIGLEKDPEVCVSVNPTKNNELITEKIENKSPLDPKTEKNSVEIADSSQLPEPWKDFLAVENIRADRLLESILKQVCEIELFDDRILELSIPGLNSFFESKIDGSKGLILKELATFYPKICDFRLKSVVSLKNQADQKKKEQLTPKTVVFNDSTRLPSKFSNNFESKKVASKAAFVPVDIRDAEKWPKSNLLIKLFDGRVEDITNK